MAAEPEKQKKEEQQQPHSPQLGPRISHQLLKVKEDLSPRLVHISESVDHINTQASTQSPRSPNLSFADAPSVVQPLFLPPLTSQWSQNAILSSSRSTLTEHTCSPKSARSAVVSDLAGRVGQKAWRTSRKWRRGSEGVVMSFPDVSVKEALSFVRVGAKVQRMKRGGGCKVVPCMCRSQHVAESLHSRVDSEKQVLVCENMDNGAVSEIFLIDIQAVHPVVVNDKAWAMNSNMKNAMLEEFKVVTSHNKLTFLAGCRKHVKYWVTALQFRVGQQQRHELGGKQIMNCVRSRFRMADINGDGLLSLDEVCQMFRSMNCFQGDYHLNEIFREFDKDGSGNLNEDEFVELYRTMMHKRPLNVYFEKYSILDDVLQERVMPWDCLCRLREEVQGDDSVCAESIAKELQKFGEPMLTESHDGLTEFGFCAYMCSQSNSIMKPEQAYLHQDMTKPLSCYWISCSHNTYLEDAQIVGTASVDQYLHVIRSGCRCVEIDCWDGPNLEPVVTHGFTMTNKISFEEVVCALRDHGFDNSPFPLILSLEMHCSEDQIVRVGQILDSTFGDMLLRHPSDGHFGEPLTSPDDARKKVIVKAKLQHHSNSFSRKVSPDSDVAHEPTSPRGHGESGPGLWPSHELGQEPASRQGDASGQTQDSSSDDEIAEDRPPGLHGSSSTDGSIVLGGAFSDTSDMVPDERLAASICQSDAANLAAPRAANLAAPPAATTASGIAPVATQESTRVKYTLTRQEVIAHGISEYNRCVYLAAVKMHSPDEQRQPCNISSLSETSSAKMTKKHGSGMNTYHESQLTRVYPPATNVNSENVSPLLHWAYGAQLVALNYQTTDIGMILHEGMFREQNGGCGYVLKPVLGAQAEEEVGPTVLTITIISAHFLPKPKGEEHLENINPLVVMSIHGEDTDARRCETMCVSNNGFCPEWFEMFKFEVQEDDVAFITFEVYHKANQRRPWGQQREPDRRAYLCSSASPTVGTGVRKFVAAAAYPVKGIRRGLRWIPLWDQKRQAIPNCGLLVEVGISREKADSSVHLAPTGRTSATDSFEPSERRWGAAISERALEEAAMCNDSSISEPMMLAVESAAHGGKVQGDGFGNRRSSQMARLSVTSDDTSPSTRDVLAVGPGLPPLWGLLTVGGARKSVAPAIEGSSSAVLLGCLSCSGCSEPKNQASQPLAGVVPVDPRETPGTFLQPGLLRL